MRSRSQSLIDTSLLIDFPPDTNYHAQVLGLDLRQVKTLLITHSHHDHYFPYDICMRNPGFSETLGDSRMDVYGNDIIERRFREAAKEVGDQGRNIVFHLIMPYETVQVQEGYTVTSLLADHNQPERSLMYIIEKDGKCMFYAHDTGIFPESTWKFLAGWQFDLVSLDCTALSRDWRQGHMGFKAVDEVRERLRTMGCIREDTTLVLNHLAHYADYTHDKICNVENPKGYEVAYDGCSYEF